MIIQTERDVASLQEHINKTEQELYARRQQVMTHSSALWQKARLSVRTKIHATAQRSLTSPVMLIAAGGVGFMAHRWVKRNFSRSPEEVELRRQKRLARQQKKIAQARRKAATGSSTGMLGQGLKLIALLRALLTALPSSWVNSLPGLAHAKIAADQNKTPVAPKAPAPIRMPHDGAGFPGAGIKTH